MSNPLLLTKFNVLFVRASLVKCDRLIERLNRGIKGKLVSISAPAGFVKTTLLCQWLHQAKMQAIWK